MNYDHNQFFGQFKFQSGYRKLYLNSPKGYSRKIINAQTEWDLNNQQQIKSIDLSINRWLQASQDGVEGEEDEDSVGTQDYDDLEGINTSNNDDQDASNR